MFDRAAAVVRLAVYRLGGFCQAFDCLGLLAALRVDQAELHVSIVLFNFQMYKKFTMFKMFRPFNVDQV